MPRINFLRKSLIKNMKMKPIKTGVLCSRCKELTTTPHYLDGDSPVCRDCLDDLAFDARFDEIREEDGNE